MKKLNKLTKFHIESITRFAVAGLIIVLALGTKAIPGISAKYASQASGSDEAKVAKFDVQLQPVTTPEAGQERVSLDLHGVEDSPVAAYSFKVTSDSEVSVGVDLRITTSAALPAGVELKLFKNTDSGEVEVPVSRTPYEGTTAGTYIYEFDSAGVMAPGQHETTYNVKICGGVHGSIIQTVENIRIDAQATLAQID